MKISRGQVIFITISLIIMLVYAIFGQRYAHQRGKNEFDAFNRTALNGIVSKVVSLKGRVGIKLLGDGNTYIFLPRAENDPKNERIFEFFATLGDSVRKVKFSDTLILKKGDKSYYYTFEKFR